MKTVRTSFHWGEMQPQDNGPVSFRESDVIVEQAAQNDLSVLPVLVATPAWARKQTHLSGSPPATPAHFTQFLRKVVARYGSTGSFWSEHPELDKRPLLDWQIWNEPEQPQYWNQKKFWKGYAKLVRAADEALEQTDPAARLILAGSVGFSWESLDRLYREGIKKNFDVVAIHPYTGNPGEVAEIVRRNRKVMRARGDGKKPLWITELSWPASNGHMKPPDGLRRVVTDDRTMAKRLRKAYRYFRGTKKRLHKVQRIYWYTWASSYRGNDDVFDYAGLQRYRDGKLKRTPAYAAFDRLIP